MALFPKTVAAVQATANATKKADQAQYEIGKALFEEAGPSGPVGVNNGSGKKLIRVQIELRRLGFPYSLEHLRDLRSVYENFPVADRSPTASWTVHLVAGDPETLKAIEAKAKEDGVGVTVRYAQYFVRERQKQATKERGREKGERNPDREIALENFRKAAAQVRSIDEHLKPHFTHVKRSDPEVCDLIEAVAELQANLAPLDEVLSEAAE